METANEQLNPSELGSILKNFSEESHKMDMMDEMSKFCPSNFRKKSTIRSL